MLHGLTIADKTIHYKLFGPAVPASASPRYVTLKDAMAVEIIVSGLNTTGVTGSAVTLNQAQAVAGTNAKALAFDRYYSSTDEANSSAMTNATAASNTFTCVNTSNASFTYRIRVDPSTLDTANGFDCLSVGLANATNQTLSAIVQIKPKYSGQASSMVSIVTD